jgi:hypothetical protein
LLGTKHPKTPADLAAWMIAWYLISALAILILAVFRMSSTTVFLLAERKSVGQGYFSSNISEVLAVSFEKTPIY